MTFLTELMNLSDNGRSSEGDLLHTGILHDPSVSLKRAFFKAKLLERQKCAEPSRREERFGRKVSTSRSG